MALSCAPSAAPHPASASACKQAVRLTVGEADAFVEQALRDPIVRLVLRRDGLQPMDVVEVINQARTMVRRRPC
jgi:hypothetical protein